MEKQVFGHEYIVCMCFYLIISFREADYWTNKILDVHKHGVVLGMNILNSSWTIKFPSFPMTQLIS